MRSIVATAAFYGKPVFVPRPGNDAEGEGEGEGEGWLLALLWDRAPNESTLEIVNRLRW